MRMGSVQAWSGGSFVPGWPRSATGVRLPRRQPGRRRIPARAEDDGEPRRAPGDQRDTVQPGAGVTVVDAGQVHRSGHAARPGVAWSGSAGRPALPAKCHAPHCGALRSSVFRCGYIRGQSVGTPAASAPPSAETDGVDGPDGCGTASRSLQAASAAPRPRRRSAGGAPPPHPPRQQGDRPRGPAARSVDTRGRTGRRAAPAVVRPAAGRERPPAPFRRAPSGAGYQLKRPEAPAERSAPARPALASRMSGRLQPARNSNLGCRPGNAFNPLHWLRPIIVTGGHGMRREARRHRCGIVIMLLRRDGIVPPSMPAPSSWRKPARLPEAFRRPVPCSAAATRVPGQKKQQQQRPVLRLFRPIGRADSPLLPKRSWHGRGPLPADGSHRFDDVKSLASSDWPAANGARPAWADRRRSIGIRYPGIDKASWPGLTSRWRYCVPQSRGWPGLAMMQQRQERPAVCCIVYAGCGQPLK